MSIKWENKRNYIGRRNANSGFSIVTMRRVSTLFFEFVVAKIFMGKTLMARHLMVIFFVWKLCLTAAVL